MRTQINLNQMDITQLKELWRQHGFRPRKRLGQNFLVDKNVRDKILNALPSKQNSTIVEVGTGFGVMTSGLASGCREVFTVEKDSEICKIINPFFETSKNIHLFCDDVLNLDLCRLTKRTEGIIVFGNIPYYISTPLIEKMIEQRNCINSVYVVMQEELADRIVSSAGSKRYGSISCFIQFYTKADKLFKIKRNSFYPKPQVDSCLLKLDMLRMPSVPVKDEKLMFKIIRKAFSERRKKIINSLSRGEFMSMDRNAWDEIFKNCKINASNRAEDLALSDYAKLADAL